MAGDGYHPKPWWPKYHADFWGSERVAAMSLRAVALYDWILGALWERGSLPDDSALVRRLAPAVLALCDSDEWDAAWAEVRACLEVAPDDPGRLRQERLAGLRDEAEQRYEAAVERGRKGGLKSTGKSKSRATQEQVDLRQDRTRQDKTTRRLRLLSPLPRAVAGTSPAGARPRARSHPRRSPPSPSPPPSRSSEPGSTPSGSRAGRSPSPGT